MREPEGSLVDLVRQHLGPALLLLLMFTALCGLAYPLAVTGFAQAAVPVQANGSIADGVAPLEGQSFAGPRDFWSRPSATGYDPSTSGATNQGPTSRARALALMARIQEIRIAHPEEPGPIPADLATASASGLDPHLSPQAALYQVNRVARARGLPPEQVRRLVLELVEPPTLGFLGMPRVNVVRLNRELDTLHP